ncbi:MAG: hypothetical protein AB1705_22895 [Verrucomicrobiota bacterium]
MKRYLLPALGLLLAVTLVVHAAQPAPATKAEKPAPGVEAAQTISMITGVAISPLLGVSAVGAWKYFDAPKEKRKDLSWFAQPWFWIPGLLLVTAAFLKDTLGLAVPTALKKPLDVAEAVENKISGLVATGAFVPIAASIFGSLTQEAQFIADPGYAAFNATALLNVVFVPFAMIAFVIVWISAHAINVLILLSPFATVDAALKSFRLFLLSTVTVTSFVDPYVGAVWSLIIILICYFLAGWAFRLTVFGTTFAFDYFTFRRTRFLPDSKENWMFLAREIGKTPIRSYGRLSRNEKGEFIFRYRPWLVFPERVLTLPPGQYAVGRALMCPELVLVESGDTKTILLMPPRYLTHEEHVARAYQLEVRDVGLIGALSGIWNFIKELCGFGPKAAGAAA